VLKKYAEYNHDGSILKPLTAADRTSTNGRIDADTIDAINTRRGVFGTIRGNAMIQTHSAGINDEAAATSIGNRGHDSVQAIANAAPTWKANPN
jgi:hypothetical protein